MFYTNLMNKQNLKNISFSLYPKLKQNPFTTVPPPWNNLCTTYHKKKAP